MNTTRLQELLAEYRQSGIYPNYQEIAAVVYGDFLSQEPVAWMWTGMCPRIQLDKPIGVVHSLWKPLYTKVDS